MCSYHLDRRGFAHEGWKTPDKENPCYQCTTGMMPDWEMPEGIADPNFDLEEHVARLLKEQSK